MPIRFLARLFLCLTALCLTEPAIAAPAPVAASPSVLFIFDSSGSMWQRVNGQPKVEAARQILGNVLTGLPPNSRLGLMSYGHRRKADCSDIELIAPIGAMSGVQLAQMVDRLNPKGITPIADALKRSPEAFKGIAGPKMIVLITDGGEECNGDPCAEARRLAASGLVVRIDVVSFSVEHKQRSEVECIANEGKGRFFEVGDKKALSAAMTDIKHEIENGLPPESPESPIVPESPIAPVARVAAAPAPAPPQADAAMRDIPEPPPMVRTDVVNLLLPAEGGKIEQATKPGWENVVNGRDRSSAWMWMGQEAVFSFKDGKAATFSRFAIGIPGRQPQNVKEFELLVSDTLEGPYSLIGHYRTQNDMQKTFYQEFVFTPVTAKYFKFRLISNYGYGIQGWGDTQVYQLKLLGAKIP